MKQMYSCIMILVLMLSMTACGAKTPDQPANPSEEVPVSTLEQTEAARTADSLAVFREDMKPPIIAVADFGFPELEEEGDIMPYLWKEYPKWMAAHEFIGDISRDRIIRTCGFEDWGNLLCIVPGNPDALVTVRIMQFLDQPPYTREIVAYSAESGAPILLLADCSEDAAVSVEVMDREGRGVSFQPCWGIAQPIPEDGRAGALVMDFTPLSEKTPYERLVSDGWQMPELGELMDTNWLSFCYAIELMDNSVPEDNGGWAMLYDVDEIGAYTLSYTGSWHYEEGFLHLTLVPELENGCLVDDSFPVLMLDEELWISRNEQGNGLPHFFTDQMSDVLQQPKG